MFHVRIAGKWGGGSGITARGTRGRRPASARHNLTVRAPKGRPHRVRLSQGPGSLQGRHVLIPDSQVNYTTRNL